MATIDETIPSLGSVPTTADPATFDARADALLGTALPAFRDSVNVWAGEANIVAGYVNGQAVASANSASASAASAVASSTSASESQTSANQAAASANFLGQWSALTGALAPPASVRHDGRLWLLLVSVPDVTASEPGVSADWSVLTQFFVEGRTSNTAIAPNDFGQIISITSGTFTQTLQAASALGAGFYCYVENRGTGDITIDPDGAEQIDGLTSFIMYPGEARLIIVNEDATGFVSRVYRSFSKTFTASGSFVTPPGYGSFKHKTISAGASGGRGSAVGGGGGGGCYTSIIPALDFGATETITVGAGGEARTTDGTGNAGGDSSIGSIVVVKGAPSTGGGSISIGGAVFSTNSPDGFSGGAVNGTASFSSAYGGASCATNGTQAGGGSVEGGAAGGGISDATSRAGGTSVFAGNGGESSDAGAAGSGVAPGGGGGATRTGTSGAGARGEVRIQGVI